MKSELQLENARPVIVGRQHHPGHSVPRRLVGLCFPEVEGLVTGVAVVFDGFEDRQGLPTQGELPSLGLPLTFFSSKDEAVSHRPDPHDSLGAFLFLPMPYSKEERPQNSSCSEETERSQHAVSVLDHIYADGRPSNSMSFVKDCPKCGTPIVGNNEPHVDGLMKEHQYGKRCKRLRTARKNSCQTAEGGEVLGAGGEAVRHALDESAQDDN